MQFTKLTAGLIVNVLLVVAATPVIKGGSRPLPNVPLWELPNGVYRSKTQSVGISCGVNCLVLRTESGRLFNAKLDRHSDLCANPTSYLKVDKAAGGATKVRNRCGS